MRSAGRFTDLQRCAAARAGHGNPICVALCQIARNLRNDHIGTIYADRIAGAQLKRVEIVQIVQVGAANCCTVHIDRIKPCSQADHSGARRSKFNAAKCGLIQFIRPFERNQAIFMVPGSAETPAIRKVVIFRDKAVNGIGKPGRLHAENCTFNITGTA